MKTQNSLSQKIRISHTICQAGTPNKTLRKTNSRNQLYLSGLKAFCQVTEIIRLKNFKLKITPDSGKTHKTETITKIKSLQKEKKDYQTKNQKSSRLEDNQLNLTKVLL